ncbi:MAG: lytic transglycosylase domain-containing protein [Nanoarchaeota archaeon]|nr:lytic transglycosylase domain-containing protein [Nanoarchaeota archaeon]MBU1631580.1 lytic transglycosylase domain-containing protein [Nanoarchaeota archaeon]MBU1876124.1 lytic transglycosylase domain-containing protein [Nanoarchaeota archaeon]
MGSSTTITKINLANDMKMMIDTFVGVSGDAVIEIPYNTSKFVLLFKESSILIFEKNDLEVKRIERKMILPENYKLIGFLEEKEKVCLEKKSKVIVLKECKETYSAPGISTSTVSTSIQAKFEQGFIEKENKVANELGIDPNYLLAVIYFETGGTFSPSQKNAAGSGATGLIQFMPNTAIALGTTTEELAKMSQVEQMDYVKKYFQTVGAGRLSSLSDVYMAVLYPKAIGESEDYVLFKSPTTAYKQNKGLDTDKDGQITKQEASSKVLASYNKIIEEKIS